MAKINGVEIKALKTFRGHEGEAAQGNVYVDGKKVGFWSQDAWGGPDTFEGCEELVRERAEIFKEGCDKNSIYYDFQSDPEVFMGHLLKLVDDEKEFKKAKKKGYGTLLLVSDGFHINGLMIKGEHGIEEIKIRYADSINKMKSSMFKNSYIRIVSYSSENDFNLTVDKKHLAPEWVNR